MSGTPQGGVVSPILANIYLDLLDQYVEKEIIPEHTRGKRRAVNPVYKRVANALYTRKKKGQKKEYKELRKQQRRIPSNNPHDPDYRRLFYVRYADDTLFGFAGPRQEAEEIKQKLGQFLQEKLKLELSREKTLITQASTQAARFLGYEIVNQQNDSKQTRKHGVPTEKLAYASQGMLWKRKAPSICVKTNQSIDPKGFKTVTTQS